MTKGKGWVLIILAMAKTNKHRRAANLKKNLFFLALNLTNARRDFSKISVKHQPNCVASREINFNSINSYSLTEPSVFFVLAVFSCFLKFCFKILTLLSVCKNTTKAALWVTGAHKQ